MKQNTLATDTLDDVGDKFISYTTPQLELFFLPPRIGEARRLPEAV